MIGFAGMIVTAVLVSTPSGQGNARISHQFTGDTTFPRFRLSNIFPESEQINMGFQLMPLVDPFLTWEQSAHVSDFTLDLYDEMERDADFHALGSAMGWSYAEVWARPFQSGHYYLYIPPTNHNQPRPAIVFLHGSGGNFKAYTWVWSKLADELDMVIIVPSFGFGNWVPPDGIDAVTNALDDASQITAIDPEQVYLAGLSNGGLGASRAAQAAPERFRGLIFLSPVMDDGVVLNDAFHDMWGERPLLIISGEQDKRIPIQYVTDRAAILQNGGIQVTLKTYATEDHFLVFSRPNEVMGDVKRWLGE
ncbi:MAG: alpha/beta fold hydrolase [Chloroflexi bacterium]|nr:alpha/beta fold hydrolase [Chloroflexota bacterium]